MAIDGLGQLSSEQIMAMSMMGNGQVTNDSSSTSDASEQTNYAFELMMKNLMDSKQKSNKNVAVTDNTKETGNDSAATVSTYKNSASKSGFIDTINAQNNNVAKVVQQCPTGQNLEKLPMVLTNGYVIPNKAASKSVSVSSSTGSADMQKIRNVVSAASKKYGVDENLILAIIKQESDFNPNDTSGCGAAGLMQVMPENFSHTGITDAYDINQNVNGGTKLFKEYLDQYNGNTEMALMAYNGGPGTMQRRGVSSKEDLYKMPKETQNYVSKVMGYYNNGI